MNSNHINSFEPKTPNSSIEPCKGDISEMLAQVDARYERIRARYQKILTPESTAFIAASTNQ